MKAMNVRTSNILALLLTCAIASASVRAQPTTTTMAASEVMDFGSEGLVIPPATIANGS